MKQFLLNIPNEVRNWSATLDAKAILQRKAWSVYNDKGIKEVYIFQNDGTLYISLNGDVVKADWKFIPVNSSLIISLPNNKGYMLKPIYFDGKILALQQDGTNNYSIMMYQEYEAQLQLDSDYKINNYLNKNNDNEKRRIEEQTRKNAWNIFIDAKVNDFINSSEVQDKIATGTGIYIKSIIASVLLWIIISLFCPIGLPVWTAAITSLLAIVGSGLLISYGAGHNVNVDSIRKAKRKEYEKEFLLNKFLNSK